MREEGWNHRDTEDTEEDTERKTNESEPSEYPDTDDRRRLADL
jgi:hypothetical protein